MNQQRNVLVIGGIIAGLLLCCVLACAASWLTGFTPAFLEGFRQEYELQLTATPVTSRAPIAPRSTATPAWGAAPPARPTAITAAGNTVLTVRNESPQDICRVVVAPASADSWDVGENLLAVTLPPDAQGEYRFTATEAHDVIVMGCDNTPLGSQAGLEPGTRTTLTIGVPGDDAAIRLENQGPTPVCVVAIIPAGSDQDAAADLLGATEYIEPGRARWLFVTPGSKDMVAIDCDGHVLSQREGRELQAQEYTWYVPDADSHAPGGRPAGLSAPLRQTPVTTTLYLPLVTRAHNVSVLRNGSFEDALAYWQPLHAGLPVTVVRHDVASPGYVGAWTALLGDPTAVHDAVPVGYAQLSQQFYVPPGTTELSFAYRLVTTDIVYAQVPGRWYDSFEVYLNTVPADVVAPAATDARRLARCVAELNQPEARPTDGLVFCAGHTRYDLPPDAWQFVTLDVREYAGQVVTLYFVNPNRYDGKHNTYTYVDAVAVTSSTPVPPTAVPPTAVPPTPAPATCATAPALPVPHVVTATLPVGGGEQWYGVPGAAGQQFTARVDTLGSAPVRLELYDEQCEYRLGFDSYGYAWVTWYPVGAEMYRVRVTGLTDAAAEYRLTVTAASHATAEAPTGGQSQGRGRVLPAPLPQKGTPPPTPVKPPPPPTPGVNTPPATAVPPVVPAPGDVVIPDSCPPGGPPALILLPETGAWAINDPRVLLAPVFVIGLGLTLAGLGSVLRIHLYCLLGFHEWVAERDGRRREGQYVYVVHTCHVCGRQKTFRLRAPADTREWGEAGQ